MTRITAAGIKTPLGTPRPGADSAHAQRQPGQGQPGQCAYLPRPCHPDCRNHGAADADDPVIPGRPAGYAGRKQEEAFGLLRGDGPELEVDRGISALAVASGPRGPGKEDSPRR